MKQHTVSTTVTIARRRMVTRQGVELQSACLGTMCRWADGLRKRLSGCDPGVMQRCFMLTCREQDRWCAEYMPEVF